MRRARLFAAQERKKVHTVQVGGRFDACQSYAGWQNIESANWLRVHFIGGQHARQTHQERHAVASFIDGPFATTQKTVTTAFPNPHHGAIIAEEHDERTFLEFLVAKFVQNASNGIIETTRRRRKCDVFPF